MSLTAFPEPQDLQVDFVNQTGDSRPKSFQKYDVSNPHPGFGKDPNILNEFGHTKFPMWTYSNIEKKRIIVDNEMELAQHSAEVKASVPSTSLKQDGPTIGEYVTAGFKAEDYPPKGYAAVSTPEEVAAFIKAASAWK